jgi:hypothetical protein
LGRFSKGKKELPLVAFFAQEKQPQSCKRLSATTGAKKPKNNEKYQFLNNKSPLSLFKI